MIDSESSFISPGDWIISLLRQADLSPMILTPKDDSVSGRRGPLSYHELLFSKRLLTTMTYASIARFSCDENLTHVKWIMATYQFSLNEGMGLF